MPRATIKVGDKITVSEEYAAKYPDEYTAGKEYEVLDVKLSSYRTTNNFTEGDATRYGNVIKAEATRVPKRKKPAAKVVLPKGTIGKDDIIGQDINKNILKIAIDKDYPTLLIGETGTGKTSIIREQAKARGNDIIRFSITGETTVDEFVGKYELENGKTVWKDGILLDAMKTGKWLVADEINVALPEILFVLHSLLDDDKFVTVSNHLGEVVRPHKDFRFFGTMNPPEEYAGTKELNKAFQSRFPVILVLNYPPAKVEAKIVADKTGVTIEDATKMADVAVALRKAKKDEKIFYTCSTRDLLHWGNLCADLDTGEAFRVSILNKAGTEAETIYDIYSHVIKRYINLEQPELTLTVDWFEAEAQRLVDERKKLHEDEKAMEKKVTKKLIDRFTAGDKELLPEEEAVEKVANAPEVLDEPAVALDDVLNSNPF